MALENNLTGWVSGPPAQRDDGGLAIVVLAAGATVDGQDHFGQPIIVSRWGSKLKTTGSAHRVSYEDVVRHIDLAIQAHAAAYWTNGPKGMAPDLTVHAALAEEWERTGRRVRPLVFGD